DQTGFVIRDRSTNGIAVSGRSVKGSTEPISFGASVTLSKSSVLTFVADVPSLPDLSGQVLCERYRLSEPVYVGLKATTYRAQDVRVNRSLALKVFSPGLMALTSYRDEFRRQAVVAAQLQHPHICKILDFGETSLPVGAGSQSLSYICMEWMDGGSLAK